MSRRLGVTDMTELFERFAVSMLLGAFIGLERERGRHTIGIRTFSLVAGLGTLAAMLASNANSPWILGLVFLAVTGLVVASRYGLQKANKKAGPGITTEVAALMTFGLGALVYQGPMAVAVALGVATAALLHFKPELHSLAQRVGSADLLAVFEFALVAFVVLPVLPDRVMGPLQVLNPHHVWLMVVFVSGISLVGYVALKLIGPRQGALASGLLGGTVSSTAVTFSFARRARETFAFSRPAAVAVMAATAVTVPRMAIEVGVVNSAMLREAAAPLACLFVAALLPLLFYWLRCQTDQPQEVPEVKNPVNLGMAILFAAIYATVILGVEAARQYLGDAGLYTVGALSGLTNVDAITLSTARLAEAGRLANAQGVDVITIAFLANLVFKGGIAFALGTRTLAREVAVAFAVTMLAGAAAIYFF